MSFYQYSPVIDTKRFITLSVSFRLIEFHWTLGRGEQQNVSESEAKKPEMR